MLYGCIGAPLTAPVEHLVYKNYAFFNGLISPLTIPSDIFLTDEDWDWTIECTFYDEVMNSNMENYVLCLYHEVAYIRRRYGSYYAIGGGTASTQYATLSAGEHTIVINDNGKNKFDGVETGDYIPWESGSTGKTLTFGGKYDGGYKWDGYIKKVKVIKTSTGDTICEYKPALYDGIPCMYDANNDSYLTTEGLIVTDTIGDIPLEIKKYGKFNSAQITLTNFTINSNYKQVCTFAYTTNMRNSGTVAIFGSNRSSYLSYMGYNGNAYRYGTSGGSSSATISTALTTGTHTVEFNVKEDISSNEGDIIIDGVSQEITNATYTTQNDYCYTVGYSGRADYQYFDGCIAEFKLIDQSDESVLCDLVPALKGGVGVMYDVINDVIYYPKSGGTITASDYVL